MRTGPCHWPLRFPAVADTTVFQRVGPEYAEAVQESAKAYLWNWTGRKFGPCPVTAELCLSGCGPTDVSMWAAAGEASWTRGLSIYGRRFPVCGPSCGCGADNSMIDLPTYVASVEKVEIGGESFDSFDLINNRWLRRTDGGRWPQCGEEKLVVHFTHGVEVPEGGQIAAGVLAIEMAKAVAEEECQLPQRVQTITRQGVSMAMFDEGEGLDKGQTGIWIVDSWLNSVRQPRGYAVVRSPDKPRPGKVRVVK